MNQDHSPPFHPNTPDHEATHARTSMTGRLAVARSRWRETFGPKGRHECTRCGASYARAGYMDLHNGLTHNDHLDGRERERYESARHAEEHLMLEVSVHTKSALVALPIFLFWAITLVLLVELDSNPAWILMSTPGYVLFAALVYAMAYGYLTGGRHDYHGSA